MIDSAPRWSLILLDAAGKQEIVSCRVPVIPPWSARWRTQLSTPTLFANGATPNTVHLKHFHDIPF
jgi:hypothetical protein